MGTTALLCHTSKVHHKCISIRRNNPNNMNDVERIEDILRFLTVLRKAHEVYMLTVADTAKRRSHVNMTGLMKDLASGSAIMTIDRITKHIKEQNP